MKISVFNVYTSGCIESMGVCTACVCGGWSNDSTLVEVWLAVQLCSLSESMVAYSDSSHSRDDVNLWGRSCDFKATDVLEGWKERERQKERERETTKNRKELVQKLTATIERHWLPSTGVHIHVHNHLPPLYLCLESQAVLESIFIVKWYSGVIGIFYLAILLVTEACGCKSSD